LDHNINSGVISDFLDSAAARPLLGLVYGRRRIGKSTLLAKETDQRAGFYFEATRVANRVQLDRLGAALGEHLGVGRIALDSWEEALRSLLALGARGPVPVVIDEFGHILEADGSIDSTIATAFGPGSRRTPLSRARLILCGSAISVMRALTAGEAPLRGRAGMELIMHADDFRVATTRLNDPTDLPTAVQVYAVIGGVVGYATDMVNFDLPDGPNDIDRWIVQRILSPGATMRNEATTLLAEDPVMTGAGSLVHHSILAAIANGAVTAGTIANKIGRTVSNLAPALNRLIDAGFVLRLEDPIRDQRPLYCLNDPFLQFHFAILDPHGALLRDRAPDTVWTNRLRAVFDSRVRGPVFEAQARTWAQRFASASTIDPVSRIGPSSVTIDGVDHELDLVVANDGPTPATRLITAIGEAKSGETLGIAHLNRLERARSALGQRAMDARLFLFGTTVDPALAAIASQRSDIEIVDLTRLYLGD
jgi:AAA+ ATPase superfamily predicted ATPase